MLVMLFIASRAGVVVGGVGAAGDPPQPTAENHRRTAALITLRLTAHLLLRLHGGGRLEPLVIRVARVAGDARRRRQVAFGHADWNQYPQRLVPAVADLDLRAAARAAILP